MDEQMLKESNNAESPAPSVSSVRDKPPEHFISILRTCGGIYFVASIIVGALTILSSFGGIGWYLGLGAGFIFQGFVIYALFNVLGLVLENLIAIRKLLSVESKQSSVSVAADDDSVSK